ncbi:cobyric acid synthase [Limimaricola hongkongensis]|uniref:Cobyric acid synthase n=1 Tax=Limimaricola hongkongensis DSM 17492 TaxID=1122180 RepID=A0A017HBN1_9RHOB|nr:cobyric acid synthase [Limimaricola hongkongensis]EYD71189.1 Cobyric acid synthase [Limimaricola hongkongensis DSM 17492]
MAQAIMIQGAGSNVGKSMIVAGLARALRRRGLSVAPFKPQNMSNNAAVTADGGEIGRAQALQARAAGLAPAIDMNPVLLKPESETGAQVVVQGRRLTTARARDYAALKPTLLPRVLDSFHRLAAAHDIVVIEGAGSPAEVNLRAGDIANMGFAQAAGVPVVLLGDIDRGGVIAQLVGSHAVLDPADARLIRGFAVNKFRGDASLFADGMDFIAARTGWAPLGIVPHFTEAWRLPAEDAAEIVSRPGGPVKIAVPRLGRIANFDDLDPLSAEPEVSVELIPPGRPLPGDADLVLIPGTKSTIADLAAFRAAGWDIDLAAHARRGGRIMGICGGYQMLGRSIADPEGIEGPPGTVEGLGLLDVETVMRPEKRLGLVQGRLRDGGGTVTGYEIHIGQTEGPDHAARAWIEIDGKAEGAASPDGRVRGCYLHGLFSDDGFRARFLAELGGRSQPGYEDGVDAVLDALAAHLERHLDIDRLLSLAAPV